MAGSVVDGHSVNGATKPLPVNSASSSARRRAYGMPVRSRPPAWTRSKAT
ncbi:hypothetical protein [Streptomyces kanasensis]|nr:hypothetical protein [Streptomyces kanasensis]